MNASLRSEEGTTKALAITLLVGLALAVTLVACASVCKVSSTMPGCPTPAPTAAVPAHSPHTTAPKESRRPEAR